MDLKAQVDWPESVAHPAGAALRPMASSSNGARDNAYLGVILAAGRGSRMQVFSDEYPKPLLPVGNKPLLAHQIELMRNLGIREIIILIGHKGYQIARVLGDGSQYGVRLRYVEQTEVLGIAHAVGQLERHVDRPFLLFLGDIFFVPRDLDALFAAFEEQGAAGVLATKEESDPDAIRRNFSVTLAADGSVNRVIEKPRHVSNNLKGVGLYLFDLYIFDAIRRTPRTAMRDEYEITDSIQVMINDGHIIRTANAVYDDLNVTYPRDLLRINLELACREAGNILLGKDCEVHPEAELINVVLGHHTRIRQPLELRNVLVFDEVDLSGPDIVENAIITSHKIVNCDAEDSWTERAHG
ncbi:MAG: nucleotidyltransferase family protein [Gammaproteobacteria bacterium]|nr:nucleotidyltransferase family protein [Gammaproteobacteria bacterium]